MRQIFLVIHREFMTRVRKKSFIIMTLLSPLLFAALIVLPSYLATLEDTEMRTVAVIDNTGSFTDVLQSTDYIKVVNLNNTSVDDVKGRLQESGYYALLAVDSVANADVPQLTIYSNKQPSIDVLQYVESSFEKAIEQRRLNSYNIENLAQILEDVKVDVNVRSKKITDSGEEKESNTLITMGIAYILSFLMYMMVLIMGSQIMQGVIEEKNNRVVEVIISSVKPFQLMMGKIIGLASVSLLQIFIWILLTLGLASVGINVISDKQAVSVEQIQAVSGENLEQQAPNQMVESMAQPAPGQDDMKNDFIKALQNQNFPLIIGGFIFYFLMGFLLYAAMFAAVGSAVENVTDTQQLSLPITLPLILSIMVMISGIKSPDGTLAFWFSMIPFTSPIIMLTRLPFGVPTWQLVLSASILVITFIFIAWMAAKIYRVGILMYGKKHTWKEMVKWIRYKN